MSSVSTPTGPSDSAYLAQKYQHKTDKQHVLDNPDTYIGSVETVDANMWVFDEASAKIILKKIELVPGLYKLFDEGIVNCRDHVIRMIQSTLPDKKCVSHIDVDISETDGTITLTNDGNGVDVAKHPEENLWIPEMIFGHLRTSTNYDKTQKQIVGGKNGFGFKLVLIWSTWGRIETVDHVRGLKYVQEFHNNLDIIDPPKITRAGSAKPYTTVSFRPDYARLGLTRLSSDMMALLKKRVYDIGGISDHSVKKIKINYNQSLVPVKNFQNYIDLYLGAKEECKRVYESASERWEYAVALSPTQEFIQVSFVNGICTFKGGKHVEYILGQIIRKLVDYIEKKKKVKVNPNTIKEQLILFLRCDIENPAFDSQTKDFMNTPSAKFGSSCSITDGFIEKVAKMGVMDMACQLTETKEAGRTKRKLDGSKTKTIRGIANFVDANNAGTDKSGECILILAEGLSAMSGIVSGLKSDDRNVIGIYPLKGKVLNVRGATRDITENKELGDLIKILGLEIGRKYTDLKEIHKCLRYGKVMIMSDQDLDGSHIKGLCINLFHSMWPSLYKIPGFICFMNTPILRAIKGTQTLRFYNEGEFQTWKKSLGTQGTKGWNLKYFKGLGTSTATEFKEYFQHKKIVDFEYIGDASDDVVDMVFNKKRAEDRKDWLEKYDKTVFLDTNKPRVQYEEFFHNEMIHFSVYDNERSIPSLVDGLKPSQRKILYSAFKRNLKNEIKVAQFSGYVSENSAYHHGEASLNGAIVKMAQNYVGSNNINLLVPNGQFGTRLKGGEDSASERYIFTYLNPITRMLFPQSDDQVLNYLNDDGQEVEPEYYVPILPFVLMNGISGIGTGFSSDVPMFNPVDIVEYIKNKLQNIEPSIVKEFIPYYEGFTGTVSQLSPQKYLIKGVYEKINADTIVIRDLPIGTWTLNYISFLEELADGGTDKAGKKIAPSIKDFTNMSTEVIVNITVVFPRGKIAELEETVDANGINGIEKMLKLTTTVTTTNMHLFNSKFQLHKYSTINEIIDDFYEVRMQLYEKRKNALVNEMELRLRELSNRAKFILGLLDGSIDLRRKKNQEVDDMLTAKKFDKIDDSYGYLRRMQTDSVTEENVAKILKEKRDTEEQLEALVKTPLRQLWLNDIEVFERQYKTYKQERDLLQSIIAIKTKTATTKTKVTTQYNPKTTAAPKKATTQTKIVSKK